MVNSIYLALRRSGYSGVQIAVRGNASVKWRRRQSVIRVLLYDFPTPNINKMVIYYELFKGLSASLLVLEGPRQVNTFATGRLDSCAGQVGMWLQAIVLD